ncbi:hypothetical protein CRG98_032352 [Punica granatum]|uniref:Uncharacterized protein n=1 Tax=Punica granatum TaxID=22663 RepID=A0A2I0IV28_PUNGR|nr:hypothetical protein CRG98_032352 [Punica granatum]
MGNFRQVVVNVAKEVNEIATSDNDSVTVGGCCRRGDSNGCRCGGDGNGCGRGGDGNGCGGNGGVGGCNRGGSCGSGGC